MAGARAQEKVWIVTLPVSLDASDLAAPAGAFLALPEELGARRARNREATKERRRVM